MPSNVSYIAISTLRSSVVAAVIEALMPANVWKVPFECLRYLAGISEMILSPSLRDLKLLRFGQKGPAGSGSSALGTPVHCSRSLSSKTKGVEVVFSACLHLSEFAIM